MAEMEFFPQRPESHPTIYAYEFVGVASHQGYIKVGYTERDVETRIKEQIHTAAVPYRILGQWSAMKNDGSCFTDHDVHAVLKAKGKQQLNVGEDRNEWFKCTLNDVKAAVVAVQTGAENVEERTQTFAMRPEQEYAVDMTMKYFKSAYEEGSGRTPKFLWNAKMRFGKTFAAYQLAKKMGMKRVLILTFKPAVQTAWREDLLTHMDFEGWQFITRPTVPGGLTNDQQYQRADKSRPIVCFGSFQDFLGVNKETGGIKANNEWVHTTNWDLVIFDEYHFGAWKDSAKKLFEQDEDTYEEDLSKYDAGNAYDETWLPITTTYYLYLSGTPFRALNSGEFMQVQHFTSVIESNPNYELVKIYTDEGVSGTSVAGRKGFQEMMADAEKGKIDLILTKSISRFGRNIVDILTALRKLSDLTPPVAVNFESEGINTSDGKNKLVISILSALAELESQQKSIAIKEGIRYRMQEGLYKFSVRNTIGYYRDYSGRIKVEPAEARIVEYIFESFLEGASPQEIADFLTEQGIRSPKGMERWRQATIRSILSNEKYCGDVLYQKTYSKDYLTHKSVKNRDVLPQYYWENNHTAIIDRETWQKAQELLSSGNFGRHGKPLAAMKKKFVVAKVKSGVLRGFMLLDMDWTKEERDTVIKIIENTELDLNQAERSQDYGY